MSANSTVSDLATLRRAYQALSPEEQAIITMIETDLRAWLRERCPRLRIGIGTSLEIVAAIGQALAERGKRR